MASDYLRPHPEIPGGAQSANDRDVIWVIQKIYVRRVGLSLSWGAVALVIVALAVAIYSYFGRREPPPYSTEPTVYTASAAISAPVEPVAEHPLLTDWQRTGFLFPDSSDRLLTDEDLRTMPQISGYSKAQLLQYAINEIYAKHHYLFLEPEYLQFYSTFDWYDGFLSAEDAAASFSLTENQNIALLIEAKTQ